jgi:hypothetical protein
MNPYIAWTPDTGTTELSTLRRGWPVEDQHTEELAWWEPKPVVARYERGPRFPRLRKFATAVAVCIGIAALSAVPSPTLDMPTVELVQR